MAKKQKCYNCQHYCYDESWDPDSGEEYLVLMCMKDHDDHIHFGADACEDFEEEE